MSKHPPLPVVNEKDEVVGKAPLEEILNNGLLHRVVHVIVEDESGKVLLQKRGLNVATNPNTWDFSAAGYVDTGESYYSAAIRELEEELRLSNHNLKLIDLNKEIETVKNREIKRFTATYKVVIPANAALRIDPNEVADIKWFDLEALKRLIENSEDITPYFKEWLKGRYFTK